MNNDIKKDLEKNIIKNTIFCLVIFYIPFISVPMVIILLICNFIFSLARSVINKKNNYWIPFLMLLYDAVILTILHIPGDVVWGFFRYFVEK